MPMKQVVRSVATLIAVASFVALAPSAAVLAASDAQLAAFETVSVQRTGAAFEARLSAAEPIEATEATVSFIGSTVQVDIAQSTFPKGKRAYKSLDQTFKSVFVYQPDDATTRIRFILNKGFAGRSFDGAVRIARADGSLTIRLTGLANRTGTLSRKGSAEISRRVAIEDGPLPSLGESMASMPAADTLDVAAKLVAKAEKVDGAESAIAIARAGTSLGAQPKTVAQDLKPEASVKTAEADIPVVVSDRADKKPESDPLHRMLLGAIVLSGALGAGAYGLKKISKKTAGGKQSAKIQILGQHFLGPKKSLAIVHVAGESLLLGITENNISLIKALSLIDDEVPTNLPNNFNAAMDDQANDQGFNQRDNQSDDRDDADDNDSFAMRGLSEIRDVVSGRISGRLGARGSQGPGRFDTRISR